MDIAVCLQYSFAPFIIGSKSLYCKHFTAQKRS